MVTISFSFDHMAGENREYSNSARKSDYSNDVLIKEIRSIELEIRTKILLNLNEKRGGKFL